MSNQLYYAVFISCQVFVYSDEKIGHVAKYAPERQLVPPVALEKSKCENQWCDGQISLPTEVGLVIADNNRGRVMIWFGTEARHSGLEEITRVNFRHFSFEINRGRSGRSVGDIYCGRIPKVFASCASEKIIVVKYSFGGEKIG